MKQIYWKIQRLSVAEKYTPCTEMEEKSDTHCNLVPKAFSVALRSPRPKVDTH